MSNGDTYKLKLNKKTNTMLLDQHMSYDTLPGFSLTENFCMFSPLGCL